VCYNGNTAARASPAWAAAGYATLTMPSTSPAYTRPIAEKRAAWPGVRSYAIDRHPRPLQSNRRSTGRAGCPVDTKPSPGTRKRYDDRCAPPRLSVRARRLSTLSR
jgi:hypothetical protein